MEIAFHEILRPPRLELRSGIALCTRLSKSAPEDLTEKERSALHEVLGYRDTVKGIAKARGRLRPFKLSDDAIRLKAAWGLLHEQIRAWLPVESTEEAEVASEIVELLFPAGRTFVNATFDALWVDSSNLLERIEEEKLEERIAPLVATKALAVVREKHSVLGEKLGLGSSKVDSSDTGALAEALRELSLAISRYARMLAGSVDEHDPASRARFNGALAPLSSYREEHAPIRNGEDFELDEEPITEEPTNPAVPPVIEGPSVG